MKHSFYKLSWRELGDVSEFLQFAVDACPKGAFSKDHVDIVLDFIDERYRKLRAKESPHD